MKSLFKTLIALCAVILAVGCATPAIEAEKDTSPVIQQVETKHQERGIKRQTQTQTQPPVLQIDTGGHMAMIRDVIFTRDGKSLVSVSDDKTIRIWNVKTGRIERVIRGQIGEGDEGKIFAAALSPDNRWLAVGGLLTGNREDKTAIRLFDYRTGEVTRLLKGHDNVILALAFSPDSRRLISGSADKTARIWDVETGDFLHALSGHTDYIYAAAFSPDGERAVTGSLDDTLILWNARTGARITRMTGHSDVRSAAFTPTANTCFPGVGIKPSACGMGRAGRL